MIQPNGYLSVPSTGPGSPVLVLHAWWGLNDTLKAFCDRLAASGFIAFAPDLYQGKIAATIPEAETLSGPLFEDLEQPRANLDQAVTYLAGRAGFPLAVIGFSLGAFFALDLSITHPQQVHSVVVFYGTHPGDYTHSRATYLGHFAETDEFEPCSEVDNLEASLRAAGRPVQFHHYPGTGHWFFEPDRPQAYNQPAAALAWERTLEFLQRSKG
jgi:carboxymethylenebutenolidase